MKFIKGFVTTIALYVGLSILFLYLAGTQFDAMFSSIGAIGNLFYAKLADPTITTVFSATVEYIPDPTNIAVLMEILGSVLPVAVAALVGSLVEKSSNSAKHIFLSTFLGLLVISAVGVMLQVLAWPAVGGITLVNNEFFYWEWFLPGALIMTALNAFVWCAIGLLATSAKWGG